LGSVTLLAAQAASSTVSVVMKNLMLPFLPFASGCYCGCIIE
jgi:hypothetical protein